MNDKKTVALALVGSFILLVAEDGLVKKQAPKPRQLVAFAVVFLMLGFMAEVQPRLAKWFSVLFFVGTALKYGPAVFNNANKGLKTPKAGAISGPIGPSPQLTQSTPYEAPMNLTPSQAAEWYKTHPYHAPILHAPTG
jgi:hypothetical protein